MHTKTYDLSLPETTKAVFDAWSERTLSASYQAPYRKPPIILPTNISSPLYVDTNPNAVCLKKGHSLKSSAMF